jgi:putative polyhydroxyalkanoate system protein
MIVVHRRHDLGLARVKRLAETIARRLQNDYGGSYAWEGNELRFRRTGAAGRVTVTKDSFQVRVELGFLLGALHSRIEREVRAFCDEHFGEEGRGEPTRPTTRRRGARGSGRAK